MLINCAKLELKAMGQTCSRMEVDEGVRLYQEQKHDEAVEKWLNTPTETGSCVTFGSTENRYYLESL
uniref:Uncharacterized protein n=1 Tax=Romanomermis culicivorax TaxID=13658 RepID=A0A915KVB7_ROMCU